MGRRPKAAAEQSIAAAFAKTSAAKKAVAKPRGPAKAKASSVTVASPELKADNSSSSAGYEKLTPAKRKEYKDASQECFGEASGAKSTQGGVQDESKRQCLNSALADMEHKVFVDVVQSTMEKANQWHPGIDIDLQSTSTNDAAADAVDPAQAAPEPCTLKQVEVFEDVNQKKEKGTEDYPEAKTVDGHAANVAEVHPADASASKQCEMPPSDGDESMLSNHDKSAVAPSAAAAAAAVIVASAVSTPCHAEAHLLESGSELGQASSEPGNAADPVKPGEDDVPMDAAGKPSELDCPEAKTIDGDAANVAEVHPADASASNQCEMPPSDGDQSMLPNHEESAVAPSAAAAAAAVIVASAVSTPCHAEAHLLESGSELGQASSEPGNTAGPVKPGEDDIPMDAAGKPSELDPRPRDEDENQKKERETEDCPEAKTVDGHAATAAEVHLADVSVSNQCEMPPSDGDESMIPNPKGNHDESAASPSVDAAMATSTPCHGEAHLLEPGSEGGQASSEPGNIADPVKPGEADVPMDAAGKPSELDHQETEIEDCTEGQDLFGEAGPVASGGDMGAEPDSVLPQVDDYKEQILQEFLEMSDSERRSKIEWADMHEDLHEYNQFLKERGLPVVSFGHEVQTGATVNACVPLSGFFAWLWEKDHENENSGDDRGSEESITDTLERYMDKMVEGHFGRDGMCLIFLMLHNDLVSK